MRELVDLTLLKYISIASSSSSTNSSLCPPHSHLLGYLCGAGRFTAMSGSLLPQSQQEVPTPPPPMDTAAQDSAASLRAAALLTLKSKKKRKLDNSDSQQQSLPRRRVTAASTIQLDYGSEAPSSSAPQPSVPTPVPVPAAEPSLIQHCRLQHDDARSTRFTLLIKLRLRSRPVPNALEDDAGLLALTFARWVSSTQITIL